MLQLGLSYHLKDCTLLYIISKVNFPFETIFKTKIDEEVPTMKFGYLGGVQLVTFLHCPYEFKIRQMIAHWKDYPNPHGLKT